MKLVNAGSASFPDAWRGYQACASYDRICWFRVPTSYDDAGILSIQHTPEKVCRRGAHHAALLACRMRIAMQRAVVTLLPAFWSRVALHAAGLNSMVAPG